jgi:hypothetical protein
LFENTFDLNLNFGFKFKCAKRKNSKTIIIFLLVAHFLSARFQPTAPITFFHLKSAAATTRFQRRRYYVSPATSHVPLALEQRRCSPTISPVSSFPLPHPRRHKKRVTHHRATARLLCPSVPLKRRHRPIHSPPLPFPLAFNFRN